MKTFERIAGYEQQKEELLALVDIFNNREKYKMKGATLPKGIVFYGAPGTGKTLFAEALAEMCSLKQVCIRMADEASGQSICQQIQKAFQKGAKSKIPTMIFFDELDKVLPNEDEEYITDRAKTILAQLLTLIDGMESSDNIVFVATCNNYYSLPYSITRPGRFDKKIGLGLPDLNSRIAILDMYIESSQVSFAMPSKSIAKLCGGFSCAALKTLVNECILRSDENNLVSESLIRKKIMEIKEEDIQEDLPEQSYIVDAIRNIGSFLISHTYNNSGYVLSVNDGTVCNSYLDSLINGSESYDDEEDWDEEEASYEDWEDEEDEEDEEYYDDDEELSMPQDFGRGDYIAAMIALLGGYAAEEVVLGQVYDNIGNNLAAADTLMETMAHNGMLGLEVTYFWFHAEDGICSQRVLDSANHVFVDIMNQCYQQAKEIIEKNVTLIKELTAILIVRKSIERKECESILADLGGISV